MTIESTNRTNADGISRRLDAPNRGTAAELTATKLPNNRITAKVMPSNRGTAAQITATKLPNNRIAIKVMLKI